jgi:sulfur carrier protein
MDIVFNGQKKQVESPMNLYDFLQRQGIDPRAGFFAAAVNDRIAKRADWHSQILGEGDRIDVVHAVQGG